MNLIDDVDFVAGVERSEINIFFEGTNIVDTVIRRAINLDNV